MTDLRMFKDRVLVRRAEWAQPRALPSGIICTTVDNKARLSGEVVAVGAGVPCTDGSRFPVDVQPGDFVLLGDLGGATVEHDGQDMIVVSDRNIVGVMRP